MTRATTVHAATRVGATSAASDRLARDFLRAHPALGDALLFLRQQSEQHVGLRGAPALRAVAQAERIVQALRDRSTPPSFSTRVRQRLRRFDEQRLVQRGQRLQRRVGARAAHAGHLAVRRVERLQHRDTAR